MIIDRWPNFKLTEFRCKCGQCKSTGAEMQPEFLDKLQTLRNMVGPLTITSGFRCALHPVELRKSTPGEHNTGWCCDIAANGQQAHKFLMAALELGFKRVGVSQRAGQGRFIHLGDHPQMPGPTVWSY